MASDDSGGVPPNRFVQNPPAPETVSGEYTGDPTEGLFGTGDVPGVQPEGQNNPDGDFPGVPVMNLTPDAWRKLAGPQ